MFLYVEMSLTSVGLNELGELMKQTVERQMSKSTPANFFEHCQKSLSKKKQLCDKIERLIDELFAEFTVLLNRKALSESIEKSAVPQMSLKFVREESESQVKTLLTFILVNKLTALYVDRHMAPKNTKLPELELIILSKFRKGIEKRITEQKAKILAITLGYEAAEFLEALQQVNWKAVKLHEEGDLKEFFDFVEEARANHRNNKNCKNIVETGEQSKNSTSLVVQKKDEKQNEIDSNDNSEKTNSSSSTSSIQKNSSSVYSIELQTSHVPPIEPKSLPTTHQNSEKIIANYNKLVPVPKKYKTQNDKNKIGTQQLIRTTAKGKWNSFDMQKIYQLLVSSGAKTSEQINSETLKNDSKTLQSNSLSLSTLRSNRENQKFTRKRQKEETQKLSNVNDKKSHSTLTIAGKPSKDAEVISNRRHEGPRTNKQIFASGINRFTTTLYYLVWGYNVCMALELLWKLINSEK